MTWQSCPIESDSTQMTAVCGCSHLHACTNPVISGLPKLCWIILAADPCFLPYFCFVQLISSLTSLLQRQVHRTFFLWPWESLYLSTLALRFSQLAQCYCSPLEKQCLQSCLGKLKSPLNAQRPPLSWPVLSSHTVAIYKTCTVFKKMSFTLHISLKASLFMICLRCSQKT